MSLIALVLVVFIWINADRRIKKIESRLKELEFGELVETTGGSVSTATREVVGVPAPATPAVGSVVRPQEVPPPTLLDKFIGWVSNSSAVIYRGLGHAA